MWPPLTQAHHHIFTHAPGNHHQVTRTRMCIFQCSHKRNGSNLTLEVLSHGVKTR